MQKFILITLSALCLQNISQAQKSKYYFNEDTNLLNAENLYYEELYRGTQYILNDQLNFQNLNNSQREIADFYQSIIGLILDDEGAENNYKSFTVRYPESAMVENSHYQLGNYYLYKQDYTKASKELSQVDTQSLNGEKLSNHYIKLGYSQFMTGDYENAQTNLEKANNSTKYSKQLDYLLGHIAYSKGDYEKAKEKFTALKDDEQFSQKVRPYMVQIYFNEKQYDEAITNGKILLQSNDYPELNNEISKIVGESYFRQKNYTEAAPYLKTYIDHAENPTLADYYQMGYVMYNDGNYTEATNYFNKIVAGDNSEIAQNAYYQLGNSYLKTYKKQQALAAFKSASEMDYNSEIKEISLLNYAKLSYEVGNPYESASVVLSNFLKKYPKSQYATEINELLVKSYIESGNFEEASKLLASMQNKSSEMVLKEQEVAYAYGIQLFNQTKIKEASTQFQKAISINKVNEFYAKSLYWNAECNYQLGNYQKALDDLKTLEATPVNISENQQIPYQKGYNYLKSGKFDLAQLAFQQYLKNPKPEFKSDAELRLADSMLGNNKLDQAVTYYDKVSQENAEEGEYSQYQKALIYGLKNDNKNKIKELESFVKKYPNSENINDAYFELGRSYAETEDYSSSNRNFEKVINNSKNNDLVAMSYLNRADNYSDQKEYQRAINEYDYISNQYAKTDYALQAVTAAKTAFIGSNKEKEYEAWAKKKGYSLSSSDAEELSFIAAQKSFLNKDYKNSISNLETFFKKYPKSSRESTARYYLGESYYQIGNFAEAKKTLAPIAKKSNEYQEEALLRLAQMYIKDQKDGEAKTALEALYQITDNAAYKSYCELELMYIYSDEKDHKKAEEMANKVLTNTKNSAAVLEQAKLIKARAVFASGNTKEAKSLFSDLEKSANNPTKAEALYYNAYFKNKEKKYSDSNDVIFNLASKLSDQQYWGAKSLIVMADNYYNLKDTYQATYTLQQVIENYKEFSDVVEEAQTLLSKIKK